MLDKFVIGDWTAHLDDALNSWFDGNNVVFPLRRGIGRLFNELLSRNYTIGIGSETWIPPKYAQNLFSHNNLSKKIDFSLFSSETGYTKANSRFYPELVRRSGFYSNELLHVGDEFKADVLQAKAAGLFTALLTEGDPTDPVSVETIILSNLEELLEMLKGAG